LGVEFLCELVALSCSRQISFPLWKFVERFDSKTIEKLWVDIFYQGDHFADDGASFAGGVRGRAHAPEAVKDDAGDGVHHGGEGGDWQDIASDFDGALFGGAFDFLLALGMGHRTDVPDIEKNFAGLREEQRREFAIIRPGAGDGAFVDGAGFGVEEERDFGDISLGAVHADVTLRLLLGIVEGMGVEKGPDELAADVFQAEFEMGVLIDGVVAAEESSGADVEALLIVDFFRVDETGRVAGASGGDGGVERMSKRVAEGDARGSRLDEFGGITRMEHARLSGHVGEAFYTEAGGDARGKERENLPQSHRDTEEDREGRKEGKKEGKERRKKERKKDDGKGFNTEKEGRKRRERFGRRKSGEKKDSRLGLSFLEREGVLLLTASADETANVKLLLGSGGFCGGVGVFLREAFDAACGVHELLLAGKERMAIRANFNVQPVPFDGGTGLEIASASAVDGYGVIVGVNTGLHESPFCRGRSAPKPAKAGTTEASLGREVTPYYSGGDGVLQNSGKGIGNRRVMAIAARYFDLVREMKNAYNHRLCLVESAKQIGIRPTARLFTTTVPTVRKPPVRFRSVRA
jgi:hypothetical protein